MDKRDKFLTEAITGSVPYEAYGALGELGWFYDGEQAPCYVPDFSTWEGFGTLWEWAQKQAWWRVFTGHRPHPHKLLITTELERYIHPDRFADAIYDYMKGLTL